MATTTVLLLNPAQLIAQGRDSRRISDLKNIDTAISLNKQSLYESLEDSTVSGIVYVSLPDTSPTCGNWDLPSLSSGWFYACVTEANLRNINGTGWIPIDFTSISTNPLITLSVDPVNNASYYYTYSWDASNKSTVAAKLESEKYLASYANNAQGDGGNDNDAFETRPIAWTTRGEVILSFADPVFYTTDVKPRSVAISNLDGIKGNDVAVTNYEAYNVSVFLNKGDGTGALEVKYPVVYDIKQHDISIDDLDNDGDKDIVVVRAFQSRVAVFLNNGDGKTFPSKNSYGVGSSPFSISIGKLNNDEFNDIVVGSMAAFSVCWNKGNGTFGDINKNCQVLDNPGGSGYSVSIGNLTGDIDNRDDIAVASLATTGQALGHIFTYINNGSGNFTQTPLIPKGKKPRSILIDDINGDKWGDIIVANEDSKSVSVFINNNGGGTFTQKDYSVDFGPTPSWCMPSFVTAGDLNGDNAKDIVVVHGHPNKVSIFLNKGDGTGTFKEPKIDFTTTTVSGTPSSVVIGDLNGDSKNDMAVTHYSSNDVSVFINTSNF